MGMGSKRRGLVKTRVLRRRLAQIKKREEQVELDQLCHVYDWQTRVTEVPPRDGVIREDGKLAREIIWESYGQRMHSDGGARWKFMREACIVLQR